MNLQRSQFAFLTNKEFKAINPEDATAVREARELNDKRADEERTRLAREFVDQAEATKEQLNQRQETDLQQFKRYMGVTGNNIVAALDMFLFNRADYRNEVNSLIQAEKKENKRAMISYANTAARAGKDTFKRYAGTDEHIRALLTTADNPGAANTVDTTVAQSIIHRAENLGRVLPLIDKISVSYGDYEEPYYNKYAMAGYLTEAGTVPDFNDDLSDATDGIKKTKWTPKDFAFGLEQSFRSLDKLSPSILNNIFKFLSEAMTRGMEYQAVSGPGTGQNDSGMITVATAISTGANVFEKFVNARSSVVSNNAYNIYGFANAKAIGEFLKLKVVNEAYRDLIQVTPTGLNIFNTPVVEVPESIIPTTAGTPDTTTVVLGDPGHYLAVTSGTLKEYVDDTPKSLQRFTAFHTLREGKARFADSFAKFTVNV